MRVLLDERPVAKAARLTADHGQIAPAQAVLQDLLRSSVILAEDWEALAPQEREELTHFAEVRFLLPRLVEHKLLTEYQAARVEAGKTSELLLGNYRVLDRIGVGGMGVVFKAEHLDLRRVVAIKVLAVYHDQDPRMQLRFLTEMRAVASLQHPNIVVAMDAGKVAGEGSDVALLRYLVMEYVPGEDLEEHVLTHGSLSAAQTCDIAYQLASALAEAHKHLLVHRDIKPSNVRLTPEGQAKLLDFGLARQRANHLTEPGTLLGTVDYMAPEQVRDASTVDIRADLYGLGGTLFWCLTGQPPFPLMDNLPQQLMCRLTQQPPSVRARGTDVPAELDAVLARMMATDPEDRYATPDAVMRALLPFLKTGLRGQNSHAPSAAGSNTGEFQERAGAAGRTQRVLIVDDEANIRLFCRYALEPLGFHCDEAANGVLALEALRANPYDMVLLDVDMPEMTGTEVCRRLREEPPSAHLKIIMISGRASNDEMARIMLAGADDYLSKPPSVVQLQARVKAEMRLKDAQDRADILNQYHLAVNRELEQSLDSRETDLVRVRNALVLALARLAASREIGGEGHLLRMERYSRCLAEEAATSPAFAGQIDANFIELLGCCAPLHDIGKAGLPDHILLKPGKLDADERLSMQTHTIIGADTLAVAATKHGSAPAFLRMAMDITRHHHERHDGTGYPDRLAGEAIPLAARLVAIADVYDALRSRRLYKSALSHATALMLMTEPASGQFDPALLHIFQRCAPQFERIFLEASK